MKRWLIIFLLSQIICCVHLQTLSLSLSFSHEAGEDGRDTLAYSSHNVHQSGKRSTYDSLLYSVDELLLNSPDSLTWLDLIRTKALLLARNQQYDKLNSLLFPAIRFAERHNRNADVVDFHSLNAVGQTFRGEYSSALRSYYKIIPLISLDSIRQMHPEIFNNMGMLYYKINDSRTAIRYYKEANAITANATSFLNIALAYTEIDSVEQVWVNVKQAETLMRRTGSIPKDSIMLHFVYGRLFDLTNPEAAEMQFLQSLSISRREKDLSMEVENLLNLARISAKRQEWPKSEAFLLEAERISERENYNAMMLNVINEFMVIYSALSDKKRLAAYQKRFIENREKLYNAKLALDIARVEGEFLEKEQQKKINVQREGIAYQKSILFYQWLTSAAGVVILILLVVLVRLNYHQLQRKNEIGRLLKAKVKDRQDRLEWEIDQSEERRNLKEERLRQLIDRFTALNLRARAAVGDVGDNPVIQAINHDPK